MWAVRAGQSAHGVIEDSVTVSGFDITPTLGMEITPANELHASLTIWRKHLYVETNVLGLNAILQLLGMYTFALPGAELNERMGYGDTR